MRRHRLGATAILVTTLAVASFSPAVSAQGESAQPAEGAAPLADLLPPEIAEAGQVMVATIDGCQPWSFFDEDKVTLLGVDADLAAEIGKLLGIEHVWLNMDFTSHIPSLQADRVDLLWSCMGDTAAREEVIDFVTYSREAEGVVVMKGNPVGITTLEDLCGKEITLLTGSMSVLWAEKFQPTCGDNPMKITELEDMGALYLSVTSGRADATLVSYGTTAYQTSHPTEDLYTQIELSPVPPFDPAIQGIAFNKEDTVLRDAYKAALEQMIADGTYQAVFDAWNIPDLTVDTIEINGSLDHEAE